ncbi:hypothetical protein LUZ60_005772 [Juncus effusus]|nr:hypothetical protein LUZ60_005772 [Juncus effusus]
MGQTGLLDLENQFAFYGAYHSNPTNILIHTFFVWPIFYTALVLLQFTPALMSFSFGLKLNLAFVSAIVYAVYYVLLDKKAGSLGAVLCFLCLVGSDLLASVLGFSLGWKVILASQLLCWTGQFIGHGVFEHRAPALLDNLAQAFLMAPFFVLLEVLQHFFRYEPYPGFQESVTKKIEANMEEWKKKNHKKLT